MIVLLAGDAVEYLHNYRYGKWALSSRMFNA